MKAGNSVVLRSTTLRLMHSSCYLLRMEVNAAFCTTGGVLLSTRVARKEVREVRETRGVLSRPLWTGFSFDWEVLVLLSVPNRIFWRLSSILLTLVEA